MGASIPKNFAPPDSNAALQASADLLSKRLAHYEAALQTIGAKTDQFVPAEADDSRVGLRFARHPDGWLLFWHSVDDGFEERVRPLLSCDLDTKARAALLLPALVQQILGEQRRLAEALAAAHRSLEEVAAYLDTPSSAVSW